MKNYKRILVTGGTGMVGNALQRVLPDGIFISSKECDLRDARYTRKMMEAYQPDAVIHLAAKVGGIKANMDNLGDFYRENILINTNVLESAHINNVKKVVSLLSTCIYPNEVTYPLTEDQIHNGPPHRSNYAYAYAKRMLDVQSQAYREQYGCNFITAVPNNLFGENDNYDLNDSHVIPAMMHKMFRAKQNNENVTLWGDGSPLREFTYSLDLANILVFLLKHYDGAEPLNVGNTGEHSIKEVAELVATHIGFDGEIVWDVDKPKGQFRKPSDNTKLLEMGWKPEKYTDFNEAMRASCDWFIKNLDSARGVH